MFFKTPLSFVVAISLALPGCGLSTGESAPKRPPPSYSGKGFSCVGKIPEHFDRYVNDQLSNEQVTEFVSCLQKAFTTFAQLTRGRNATSYSPDEIRQFLHSFFLNERRLKDELMGEVMILKQAILGGSSTAISREELHALVEMLEEFKNEAIRLKPHLRVLNPRLAQEQDPATLGKRLADANEALNSVIKTLAMRLQRNQRNYTLASLQSLLVEFRAFAGWDEHFPDAISPAKWVSFIRIFRQLTVAPIDPNTVRPLEWTPMLQSFARWYLVYLQYQIGVKDQPILRGVGLQNTIQLANDVFNLIEQAASKQEGLTIRFAQLDELTKATYDLRWIPAHIPPSSINGALAAVVTRILGDPEIPASQRKTEGLALTNVARARDIFFRWAYIQMNLDTRLAGTLAAQKVVPNVQIRPYMTPDVRLKLKSLGSSEWDDFLSLRGLMRPLFADGSYRVGLVRHEDLARNNLRHTYHNLTLMNLWRTSAQALFRGYAEHAGSRIGFDSGITLEEVEKFYADFREIGIALKLVDQRNPNMGNRDFTAANLFTYSGDGINSEPGAPKGRLRMVEAIELFSFMLSGGRLADDFYADLKAVCPHGPPDMYKRPKLDRNCVLENLPATFDAHLGSMPDLQQFLRVAPLPIRQAHARTLLETAFSPKNSVTPWVEYSEFTTLAVVMHYAEAVMTRFDADRDGTLSNPEIDPAAEIFMGFIKKFAKDKMNQNLSDRQAKGAFYYILTNREMPTGFWDIAWLTYVRTGNLSLNRADLSTVFKVIIAKLFDTVKKPDPPPPNADMPQIPCLGSDLLMPPNCI